jgi:hypothetical protein
MVRQDRPYWTLDTGIVTDLDVRPVTSQLANALVIEHHYLHRRTSISYAFGLFSGDDIVGVVTFGTPPSRHLQMSACPSDPSLVIELNRLWVHDDMPRNSESWFVSRALKLLPALIVVSYADPKAGHYGYVYRALNFNYGGWTDMERKTPRFDYVPLDPSKHTREAFRSGYSERVRRIAKVKYWIAAGPNRTERKHVESLCGWPKLSWQDQPPPIHLS